MQNELVIGVYRLYDKADEHKKSFVGFSYNVYGTLKRLRFELALNACSYKPLQRYYAECKEPELEILEKFVPEDNMSDAEIEMHLQAKVLVWCEKFESAELVQQQVE